MNKTILLTILFILISVGVVYATTPASVSGKPSIYDNWDTSVYELGLVAFYRFDNESSVGENDSIVYDWSTPQNNGTITEAVYNLTNKKLGDSSMNFDGDDDYIIVADDDSLTVSTGNLTLSAWIRRKEVGQNHLIIMKHDTSDDGDQEYGMSITSSDQLRFYGSNSTNAIQRTDATFSYLADVWYMVTITFNNATNNITFYRDGIQSFSEIYNDYNLARNTNKDLRIGVQSGGTSLDFNGIIDEMMIFNRTLTSTEVFNLYTQQNGGCVVPYEDMNIISNVTLCNVKSQLNDSGKDGAIRIASNDVTLTCDNTNIVGNWSGGNVYTTIGIKINILQDNIGVRGCNITGYHQAISIGSSDNILIENNTFDNIYEVSTSGSLTDNITIKSNTIRETEFYGFYVGSSNHYNITGNSFFGTTRSIRNNDEESLDVNINNNNFYDLTTIAIYLEGTEHKIRNNLFQNDTSNEFIFLLGNGTQLNNHLIENNIFNNSDKGILFYNISYSNITNNTFYNINTNTDFYATGIHLTLDTNNIIIKNNTFIDYGSVGILVQRSQNISIYNTTCNQMSIANKITNSFSNFYEPTACIFISEIYKGYLGDVTESVTDNRTNKISYYNSSNVIIDGITYDSNVQTILRLQGTINATVSNVNNYWYRKMQFPVYLVDVDEFYISNTWDRLSDVPLGTVESTIFMKSYPNKGNNEARRKFNYTISKTVMSFKNVNKTTSYELRLFNLTDQPDSQYVQIFNQTSTTPTSENSNTFTETIPPNNRTLVFSFLTSTQPKFSEIAITVTDMNYTYSGNILTLGCTGTGSIKLTNMDILKGTHSFYVHYKDGSKVTYSRENDYTISSCSTHSFYGATPPLSFLSKISSTILRNGLAVILAIFILIILITPLVIFKLEVQWTTNQWITYFIGSLITVFLIIALIKEIFNV